MYKLVITSLTQKELTEAVKYYADRSPASALRLLKLIEEAYNKLSENPQFYSFFGSSKLLRSLTLKNFPYSFVFRIKADEVELVGLHNHYKNPDRVLNRIDS